MKVLAINLALRPNAIRKLFPIGLGYILTAVKNAGYHFDFLDLDVHRESPEQTEEFLRSNKYDVVMLGCIVTGYRYIKWITNVIKGAYPETKIIVGNSVASSVTHILLRKTRTDIAVMGEGDNTIIDLLKCIKNKGDISKVRGIAYIKGGNIVKTPAQPPITDIDSLHYIDWDIFDINTYIQALGATMNEPLPPIPRDKIRPMPINTARGCPFKCTFCYHVFIEYRYRWRSAESIVSEMKILNERYGINYFTFNDELTFFSIKQAETFADTLLASGLKVYWDSDCRGGLFKKDEHIRIAEKIRDAGCMSLGFALESANEEILKWMNKKVNLEDFARQAEIFRKAKLPFTTSIVLGYPNENEQTIRKTIDYCIKYGLYPSAGYLLPQPGTKMYDYALENGYIKDEEEYLMTMGDRQDLHVNMTNMSKEEFVSIVKRELARCNRELGLTLKEGALLKTGHYRVSNKDKKNKF